MNLLIDTDVVSFVFKNDTRTELYKPHLEGNFLLISFMTLAELNLWTLKSNWGKKRKNEFAAFLTDYLVIYPDESICRIWAEVQNDAQKKGNPIETSDAWVASVAILFDIPLVTHNRKHFENVADLQIISES